MMSVLEYANDIGKTVKAVLSKCQELNIKVVNEDDLLNEDNIVTLDNAYISNNEEIEEEIADEEVEEIISKTNIKVDDTVKVQKLKKKSEIIQSKELASNKKNHV